MKSIQLKLSRKEARLLIKLLGKECESDVLAIILYRLKELLK